MYQSLNAGGTKKKALANCFVLEIVPGEDSSFPVTAFNTSISKVHHQKHSRRTTEESHCKILIPSKACKGDASAPRGSTLATQSQYCQSNSQKRHCNAADRNVVPKKGCVSPGGFNTVVDHGCGPQYPLIDTRNPADATCGAPGYRAFKHLIILTKDNA